MVQRGGRLYITYVSSPYRHRLVCFWGIGLQRMIYKPLTTEMMCTKDPRVGITEASSLIFLYV